MNCYTVVWGITVAQTQTHLAHRLVYNLLVFFHYFVQSLYFIHYIVCIYIYMYVYDKWEFRSSIHLFLFFFAKVYNLSRNREYTYLCLYICIYGISSTIYICIYI